MEKLRKPFQGVLNIIRFNRHFHIVSFGTIALLLFLIIYFDPPFKSLLYLMTFFGLAVILISLFVSYLIYDRSDLYTLNWLDKIFIKSNSNIVNINAGFDETSEILFRKFNDSQLTVFDFYDPDKHTEISIERARKAYPPFPDTIQIETNHIPLKDMSVDYIFLILSAHEIRNETERSIFLKELNRIIKPDGLIIVTEHLRDTLNFLAYTVGVFHFHPRKNWLDNFVSAGLIVKKVFKITPFITTFVLEKNGTSA